MSKYGAYLGTAKALVSMAEGQKAHSSIRSVPEPSSFLETTVDPSANFYVVTGLRSSLVTDTVNRTV
jgi:hypothetical protein